MAAVQDDPVRGAEPTVVDRPPPARRASGPRRGDIGPGDPGGNGPASTAARPRRPDRRRLAGPPWLLVGALTAVLLAIGATFSATAPGVQPWQVVLGIVGPGLFLVAGLLAWRLRPHNRIGLLLLLTGLSMWVTALVDAPVPVLVAVGIATQTMPLALTLHLLLAFPSGRVRGRAARTLVVVGYLTCTVLQAPLFLLGDGPLSVWSGSTATGAATVAGWAQTVVGVGSVLGAAVVVATGLRGADAVERRLLGPVVWYRLFALLALAAAPVVARLGGPAWLDVAAAVVQNLAVLGLPVVFLAGLVAGAFGRAGELDELVAEVGTSTPSPAELSTAVAAALGEPGAVVVYARGDGTFVDDTGVPAVLEGRDRRWCSVVHDGRVVGAIVYRQDVVADDALVAAVADVVSMAIDRQRSGAAQRALVGELRRSRAEVDRSRRRLVQAEDAERRRVARDLHDGAQQHIVALGLAARQLSRRADDERTAGSAAEIADGLTDLLVELRHLVAGIMPAPLVERGLVAAVQALADRMPVPVRVSADPVPDELPAAVESSVYFLVSEALANVAKHAHADRAEVRLAVQGSTLRVVVDDDGVGGARTTDGTGLAGLGDRVAALGGTFTVRSVPAAGTTVSAEIPCG